MSEDGYSDLWYCRLTMNDEPTIQVPPELDAAIDAVFAYGKPMRKRVLDEPLGDSGPPKREQTRRPW